MRSKSLISSGGLGGFSTLTRRTQCRVVIQLNHLLDDAVVLAAQLSWVIHLTWVISALAQDPILLSSLHVPLEGAVIVANHLLDRVIEPIADIVSARRNEARSLDVVDDECFAIWADAFEHLRVEAAILLCAVGPFFVLVGQVIVEEVAALDQLATVPFGNVPSLKEI